MKRAKRWQRQFRVIPHPIKCKSSLLARNNKCLWPSWELPPSQISEKKQVYGDPRPSFFFSKWRHKRKPRKVLWDPCPCRPLCNMGSALSQREEMHHRMSRKYHRLYHVASCWWLISSSPLLLPVMFYLTVSEHTPSCSQEPSCLKSSSVTWYSAKLEHILICAKFEHSFAIF